MPPELADYRLCRVHHAQRGPGQFGRQFAQPRFALGQALRHLPQVRLDHQGEAVLLSIAGLLRSLNAASQSGQTVAKSAPC